MLNCLKSYCGKHAIGGVLHFVLYDLDCSDTMLDTCLGYAKERKDKKSLLIATELRKLNKESREEIIVESGVSWKSEL